jgi:DNA-binding transcriptional LysR family regulator
MRYTLRQLEYFIAAGETGSITIASERIHISPPSISTAIAHLERELGIQLFIRHHAQGLSLTPAGRDLLREAKSLIAQAEGLYTLASRPTGRYGARSRWAAW